MFCVLGAEEELIVFGIHVDPLCCNAFVGDPDCVDFPANDFLLGGVHFHQGDLLQ